METDMRDDPDMPAVSSLQMPAASVEIHRLASDAATTVQATYQPGCFIPHPDLPAVTSLQMPAASVEIDRLASDAATIVQAAYQPGVKAAELQEARETLSRLLGHNSSAAIASRLVTSTHPEVRHFGLQVMLEALRLRPLMMTDQQRSELKLELLGLLADGVGTSASSTSNAPWAASSPPYVQAKCAEVIAEIARFDWPARWSGLRPALEAAGSSACSAVLALALCVWHHIVDTLSTDCKEMSSARRRELSVTITDTVEKPPKSPFMIVFLEQGLQRHGADSHVVREALSVCRALACCVPVQTLLRHNLHKIVQVGLESLVLREAALLTAAAWVEQLNSVKPNVSKQEGHIFVTMLAQLSCRCLYDGDLQNYAYHFQIAQLLFELCSCSAGGLCASLPFLELSQIWRALLHFLRYPSVSLQADALTSMSHIAKLYPGGTTSDEIASAQPPLNELFRTIFVHQLKIEGLPSLDLVAHRSVRLLQSLGQVSATKPPTTFHSWCQFLHETYAFHLDDGDSNSAARKGIYGDLKSRSNALITELCKNKAGYPSPNAYSVLCQQAAEFATWAMKADAEVGGCAAEFEAAVSLVERSGPALLQKAERESLQALPEIVQISLAMVRAVTKAECQRLSVAMEQRRIVFLSHWAPFFNHFDASVVADAMQLFLVAVKRPLDSGCGEQRHKSELDLQFQALEAVASFGKCGAFKAAQLEELYVELARLHPSLTPQAQGKICEAVAASVAASKTLDFPRKVQIVEDIMGLPSKQWLALDFQPHHCSAMFAEALLGMSSAPTETDSNFVRLSEIRALVSTFTGVVTKVAAASRKPSAPKVSDAVAEEERASCEERPLECTNRLLIAWVPGIIQCLQGLLSLTVESANAAQRDALSAILGMPSENEHRSMLGGGSCEAASEALPSPLVLKKVRAARSLLWELRVILVKAVRACVASTIFWQQMQAIPWLSCLAQTLPNLRPHTADLLLKEVFSPMFGYKGEVAGEGLAAIPSVSRSALCSTVIPPLISGATELVQKSWKCAASGVAHVHPQLDNTDRRQSQSQSHPALETALASSLTSFSRTFALLLASLGGAGTPQAGVVADPERGLFRRSAESIEAPSNQQAPLKKRKLRNTNRFAALADADEVPVQGKSDKGPTDVPDAPPGAAAWVMQDTELREHVRVALVELLRFPDPETVTLALMGLATWVAQTWNLVARGKGAASIGLGYTSQSLKPGELLHTATDVLRCMPSGVLQPVVKLVGEPSVSVDAALNDTNAKSWATFVSSRTPGGKASTSGLVQEATSLLATVFLVLSKLFRIQCRKVKVEPDKAQLYLCPALVQSVKICANMPRSSESDVYTMLEPFLKVEKEESQKLAVRRLLECAVPVKLA